MSVSEALAFITDFSRTHPGTDKDSLSLAALGALGLKRERSVYAGDDYALRFSSATGPSFANVVLSLSALHKYDHLPFIVVVVRPGSVEFLLANSTFLRKISHSSHRLTIDNVKGSFLGHDILRDFNGISNRPENFEQLFALHHELGWEENLARLVEATTSIAPRGARFIPRPEEMSNILAAPELAERVLSLASYHEYLSWIRNKVQENAPQIAELAKIDNVNVRGNRIEQAISGALNAHGLSDLVRKLEGGIELHVEIKTKLLGRASSPKAYNIDKLLGTLARGQVAISYCFIGIDAREVTVSSVSVFDKTVLDATRVQFHWAGRSSRGVTQLTGDLKRLFLPSYKEQIDVEAAKAFLRGLVEL